MTDHLTLVDGSAYIFRAYHALPPLTRSSDHLPIGALAGFCAMIWRFLKEENLGAPITHIAVIFDTPTPTFRHHLHSDYKAHRPKPPSDLIPQFRLIHQAVDAFSIKRLAEKGYEADDLIATYAHEAEALGMQVTIVGSDKDLMQLVTSNIRLFDPIKRCFIGESEVNKKFGVSPLRVPDVQALVGDSSDNIPGIPGIGIKTASKLISEYGTLENLLSHRDVLSPKQKKALEEGDSIARLGKKLATLDIHAPLSVTLDDLRVTALEPKYLISFLKAFDLKVIARRVAQFYDADITLIDPDSQLSAPGAGTEWVSQLPSLPLHSENTSAHKKPASSEDQETGWTPDAWAHTCQKESSSVLIKRENYEIISSLHALEKWCCTIHDYGVVALDIETTSLIAHQAELVGLSLCVGPGSAAYIPLQHRISTDIPELCPDQLSLETVINILKPVLTDPSILKIGHNIKYDALILRRYGVTLQGYDDTMLMSYALDAGRTRHNLDTLAHHFLSHTTITYDSVTKRNKKKVSFDYVPIPEATAYAAEDAEVTFRLWKLFCARLTAEGRWSVYCILDRPVIKPVISMEQLGIKVDKKALERLSHDFSILLEQLEKEIYALAGENFSIGSPQQVGTLLFEKIGLKTSQKTSTGKWSTGSDVLEELAAQGHALPEKILEWRHLAKLRATYTEALLEHMDPISHRVHTSYGLAGAITGRFSSSDPNLQNIPIRTESGRAIRAAFIAEKGYRLLSADYAQIELRLLAHASGIPKLIAAFENDEDIHSLTAAEIFEVSADHVTPDMRRHAKTINFGILYGMSAFSLSGQMGVSRGEAQSYLQRYFERFSGIKEYVEHIKDFCRTHGYVTTFFGRVCHYPNILSPKASERAFAERQAANATLQGSAADIIRRAMAHMPQALLERHLKGRLLLQVHDELVLEVPDDEVEATRTIVAQVMERAPLPVINLRIPLKVTCSVSHHWGEEIKIN